MEQRLRYLREQISAAEEERARLAADMLHRETTVGELRKMNARAERQLRACITRAAREIARSAAPEFTWLATLRERMRATLTTLSRGPGGRG